MELLAKVLPSLAFAYEGRVAYLSIPNDLYDKNIHTDSFVNYPRYIEGVDVAFMVKAVEPNLTRVSLRSTKAVDGAQIAFSLGGEGTCEQQDAVLKLPWMRLSK